MVGYLGVALVVGVLLLLIFACRKRDGLDNPLGPVFALTMLYSGAEGLGRSLYGQIIIHPVFPVLLAFATAALAHIVGILAGVSLLAGWLVSFSWLNSWPGILRYTMLTRFVIAAVVPGVFWGGLGYMAFLHIQPLDQPDLAEPQLAIDFVEGRYGFVPQTGQPAPPKVSKFAQLRVTNIGKKRINGVKLTVIRIDDFHDRWPLPIASHDTIFRYPNPSRPLTTVSLNPTEDQFFDVLVECNGTLCRKGEIAVPFVQDGRRRLGMLYKKDAYSRPQKVTVRASGEIGPAVTKTFAVSVNQRGIFLSESDSRKKSPMKF